MGLLEIKVLCGNIMQSIDMIINYDVPLDVDSQEQLDKALKSLKGMENIFDHLVTYLKTEKNQVRRGGTDFWPLIEKGLNETDFFTQS
jgi:hypothetical protein